MYCTRLAQIYIDFWHGPLTDWVPGHWSEGRWWLLKKKKTPPIALDGFQLNSFIVRLSYEQDSSNTILISGPTPAFGDWARDQKVAMLRAMLASISGMVRARGQKVKSGYFILSITI